MVPELSPAGLPARQLNVLLDLYTTASDRMQQIVLNPQGRTQGSREFRQARAAQQIAQIDQIRSELGSATRAWTASGIPQAYLDGQLRGTRQAVNAGVRVPASAVQGGFSSIDRDSVSVFAQAVTFDLSKAEGSLAANATKAIRTTAQTAIPEAQLNKLLAGGLISGDVKGTTKEIADALKAVVGAKITIPTKTGGTMEYSVREYADLVVTTQTRKANEVGRHNKLKRLGIDLVAIIGALSQNFCTAFLGQVFSISGQHPKYPPLSSLPGGGPPFHPRCSKSTRPYADNLATDDQRENAKGLDDAKKLAGVSATMAQRMFKDLQLLAQVKGNYAKGYVPRAGPETTTGIEASQASKPAEVISPAPIETPAPEPLKYPDPITAPYVEVSPGVSENALVRVRKGLETIPEGLREVLAGKGVTVKVGVQLTELFPELKTAPMRGWPPGSTWDLAEGCCHNGVAAICEQRFDRDLRQMVASGRIAGTLRHEYGHSVDHHLGLPSRNAKFVEAHAKDLAAMSADVKAVDRLQYFLQPNDFAGQSETFAEVFAALYGGGAEPASTLMLDRFPNSAKAIREMMEALHAKK